MTGRDCNMKAILIVFLLIPLGLNAQIKPDKYYHAGAGTGIAISSHLILKGGNVNPMKGTLITVPIAFGKEMHDSFNGGKFSGQDFFFTVVSAAIIDLSVLGIKKIFKKKTRKDPFYIKNDGLVKI
jgi:hypothetical protein